MKSKIRMFAALLPFMLILGALLYYTSTKVRATLRSQLAQQVEFLQRAESERLADYLKQHDRTCRYISGLDPAVQLVAWSRQRPNAKDLIGQWRQQLRTTIAGLTRPDGELSSDIQEIALLDIDGRPLLRLGRNNSELPLTGSPFESFLESIGIASMTEEDSFRSPVIQIEAKGNKPQETPVAPETGSATIAPGETGSATVAPAETEVPGEFLEDASGARSTDLQSDTERVVYFGYPIIFGNKVAGVMLLGLSLENVLSRIPSSMEVFGARASIITWDPSQSGEYLAHFERERILNRQKDLNRTAEYLDLKSDAEKILQPGNAFQKYLSGKNSRILLTAVPIRRTSWVLMTLTDTSQMLTLFEKTLRSSMMLVMAALIGLTLVMIVFMSRWSQAPALPALSPAAFSPPPQSAPREVSASELGFPDPTDSSFGAEPEPVLKPLVEESVAVDRIAEPAPKDQEPPSPTA